MTDCPTCNDYFVKLLDTAASYAGRSSYIRWRIEEITAQIHRLHTADLEG